MYLTLRLLAKSIFSPFVFEAVAIDTSYITNLNTPNVFDRVPPYFSLSTIKHLSTTGVTDASATPSDPSISSSLSSSLPPASSSEKREEGNALPASSTSSNVPSSTLISPIIAAAADGHKIKIVRFGAVNSNSENTHTEYSSANGHFFSPDLTKRNHITEPSSTREAVVDLARPQKPHRKFIKLTTMSKKEDRPKSTRSYKSVARPTLLEKGGTETQTLPDTLVDGCKRKIPIQQEETISPVLPLVSPQPIQKAVAKEHTNPIQPVTPVDHEARAYSVVNIQKSDFGLVALKTTTKSLVNKTEMRSSPALHSVSQGPRKAVQAVNSPSATDVTMKEISIPRRSQTIIQTKGKVGKNDILSRQAAREREAQEKEEEETDKFLLEMGKGHYTKRQSNVPKKPVQQTSSSTATPAVNGKQSSLITSTSSSGILDQAASTLSFTGLPSISLSDTIQTQNTLLPASMSSLTPERVMDNVEDVSPSIPVVIETQEPSNLVPLFPSTPGKGKSKAIEVKPSLPYPRIPVIYEPDYEIMLFFSYPRSSWTVSHLHTYSYTSRKYPYSSQYIRVISEPSSLSVGSTTLQASSVSKPRPEVGVNNTGSNKNLLDIEHVSLTPSSLPPAIPQSLNPPHDLLQESWKNSQQMDIDEIGSSSKSDRGNTGGIETFAKSTDAPAPTPSTPDQECNPVHEDSQEALKNPQQIDTEATRNDMIMVSSDCKSGQGNTGGFETFAKCTDAPAPTPFAPGQEQNGDCEPVGLPLPSSSQIVVEASIQHQSQKQGTEVENRVEVKDTGLSPSPNYENAVLLPPDDIRMKEYTIDVDRLIDRFGRMTIVDSVDDSLFTSRISVFKDAGHNIGIKLTRPNRDDCALNSTSNNYQLEHGAPEAVETTKLFGSDDAVGQMAIQRNIVKDSWTEDSIPQLDAHTVDPLPVLLVDVLSGESGAHDLPASTTASEGFTAAHSLLATTSASAVALVDSEHEVERTRVAVDDLIPFRPMRPNFSSWILNERKPIQNANETHTELSSYIAQSFQRPTEVECFEMEGILFHTEELAPPSASPSPSQLSPTVPETPFYCDEPMEVDDKADVEMEDASGMVFSFEYPSAGINQCNLPSQPDLAWQTYQMPPVQAEPRYAFRPQQYYHGGFNNSYQLWGHPMVSAQC